ncbi:MAG: hypothetical protein ACOC5K_03870, partial [Chloroflexota bacterium]
MGTALASRVYTEGVDTSYADTGMSADSRRAEAVTVLTREIGRRPRRREGIGGGPWATFYAVASMRPDGLRVSPLAWASPSRNGRGAYAFT